MRSLQDVFDEVALHLLRQGQKSASEGICYYRGPDGLKCAAGFLIPDELYHESFEGNNWSSLARSSAAMLEDLEQKAWHSLQKYLFDEGLNSQGMVALIAAMQSIHDGGYPLEWPERLRILAMDLELSPAVLDEFSEIEKENARACRASFPWI